MKFFFKSNIFEIFVFYLSFEIQTHFANSKTLLNVLLINWKLCCWGKVGHTMCGKVWKVIYIYIDPLVHSSWEHRVSTQFLHRTLSFAIFLTCCHVILFSANSSLTVRRHVLRGLPLLLLPWGFHSNAIFAISKSNLSNIKMF